MKTFLNKMAVAARLAAKELRCLKLTRFDLAKADLQLGEKAYASGIADGQADLVSKLDLFTQRLTDLRRQEVQATSTFGDKAKAFVGKLAQAVQLGSLQRKRRRILRRLGAKLRQGETNNSLSEETRHARGVADRLGSVETQMRQLAPQTYPWARQPLLLTCLLLLLAVIGAAFGIRHPSPRSLGEQRGAFSEAQMKILLRQQQNFQQQMSQMHAQARRRESEQTQARIGARSDEHRRDIERRAQNEVDEEVAAAEQAYREQHALDEKQRQQHELEEQKRAATERARVEEHERQQVQLAIAEKQRQEQAEREAEAKRIKEQEAAREAQKKDAFDAKLREAAEKLDAGQHAESFKLYEEAISMAPDNPKGYLARGSAFFTVSQKEAALKNFDEALKYNPKEAEAYFRRGTVHASNSDHEKAIADFTKALECRPDYADAYYERGVSRAAMKQFKEARQDFDSAIRLNPKHALAYFNRGRALVALHETGKALSDYNHAVEFGNGPEVLLARADAYFELGKYESAQKDLETAVSLDPECVPAYLKLVDIFSALKNEPLALLNRGRGYFYSRDYAKATAEFEQAVKLQPTLAVAHLELGRSKSAEAILAIAATTAGTRPGVMPNIRVDEKIQTAASDVRDRIANAAVVSLKKATELNPNDTRAWMELGKAYFFWDGMSAIAAFEHVLELNPKSADAHFWLGLTKYTWGDEREAWKELSEEQFRAKLALKELNTAIELDRQHAGAYYLRASVYRRFERYAEAIEDLTAAIKRALPSQCYPEYGAILYSPSKRMQRQVSDIPDELIAVSLKAAAYAQRAQCQFEQGDQQNVRFGDLDEVSRLVPKEPKLSQLRALLRQR